MNNAGRDPADQSSLNGAIDLQVIEQLFQEHLSPLTRFVYSYVKSWEVAEDVVQGAFFQLWLRRRNLEQVRDLVSYLYTIAKYDALDFLRHQDIEARHRNEPQDDGDFIPDVERDLLASEASAVLQRAIDALPARQREILLLRLKCQASYQEIATTLQVSRKTVDTHLQRAFVHLRKMLPKILG